MSRFVRIACGSFRCPSFSYISHPGRRACRARRTEHHHARPRLCRQYRSASQDGPRRLARQQRGLPERHPPASVSRDGVTSTSRLCRTTRPAGSTNTSPAPSLSLWTCSRRARSTSCPTSPTPRNAPKSCSFPRTPRAPSATSSTPSPIETIWPRVTPSAPRPYHRLQPRRYANLRWPAVARQRRHYLHL